jgi:hypothetical protein
LPDFLIWRLGSGIGCMAFSFLTPRFLFDGLWVIGSVAVFLPVSDFVALRVGVLTDCPSDGRLIELAVA